MSNKKLELIWEQIADWYKKNKPEAWADFRIPANSETIEILEKKLKLKLPAQLRSSLLIHNGQIEGSAMFEGCSLLSVEDIEKQYQWIKALDFDSNFKKRKKVDQGINKPIPLSGAWVPVALSSSARTYLCLDLDPDIGGQAGQVIRLHTDNDALKIVAVDFVDLLEKFLLGLKSGQIEVY